MPGFRTNANGIFCCGPSIFVSAGFVLSIAASTLCNFLELDEDNERRQMGVPVGSIGFWCFETPSGGRYSMSNLSPDDNFDRARAFGLTANIIGFCVWLFYLFAACVPFPPTAFSFVGLCCEVTCMFEGFKFWMLRSTFFCDGEDLGCSIDTAARCSISACVFWFLSGMMTCAHAKELMNKPDGDDEPVAGGDEGGEVEP